MSDCKNTKTGEVLVEKIDFLLEGINRSRDTDLKIAQTVLALSEAYKNTIIAISAISTWGRNRRK